MKLQPCTDPYLTRAHTHERRRGSLPLLSSVTWPASQRKALSSENNEIKKTTNSTQQNIDLLANLYETREKVFRKKKKKDSYVFKYNETNRTSSAVSTFGFRLYGRFTENYCTMIRVGQMLWKSFYIIEQSLWLHVYVMKAAWREKVYVCQRSEYSQSVYTLFTLAVSDVMYFIVLMCNHWHQ